MPAVREVIDFLSHEYHLPAPRFSVPFPVAYGFARLMELIDPLVPWEPLVTRSIIHLLEDTGADNGRAAQMLGYRPRVFWQDAIRLQMQEMNERQHRPMRLYKPVAAESFRKPDRY